MCLKEQRKCVVRKLDPFSENLVTASDLDFLPDDMTLKKDEFHETFHAERDEQAAWAQ